MFWASKHKLVAVGKTLCSTEVDREQRRGRRNTAVSRSGHILLTLKYLFIINDIYQGDNKNDNKPEVKTPNRA